MFNQQLMAPALHRPVPLRRFFPRSAVCWLAASAVLSLHCGGGGGGRGPTGPPPGPATLFGRWQGTMQGTRTDNGAALSCTVAWRLEDAGGDPGVQVGIGEWNAACSDGTSGQGLLNASLVFFAVVALGLPARTAQPPMGGCSWGAGGTFTGNRIAGTWNTPTDGTCALPVTGTFEVTK